MPRTRAGAAPLLVAAACGAAAALGLWSVSSFAFAASGGALPPQAPGPWSSPGRRPQAARPAAAASAGPQFSARGAFGLAVGSSAGFLVAVAAARGAASARATRIAAQVAKGAPSLIQVLEQKRLLSTVENLKLLSQAEQAGVGIATVEELGLLKLIDDLKLLSFTENLLTNPSTPALLFAGGAFLGGLAYLDVTAADFGFLQWVIAGALGAPALVLEVAAVAILVITGGARRTKAIDIEDTSDASGSATLLETIEKRRLLSYLEENRLLSFAAGLVNKPLTLTEQLRVLSQLERSGLLSTVESTAADKYGAAKIGVVGLLLLPLAAAALFLLPPELGAAAALLLGLAALAFIAVGVAIGAASPPPPSAR